MLVYKGDELRLKAALPESFPFGKLWTRCVFHLRDLGGECPGGVLLTVRQTAELEKRT